MYSNCKSQTSGYNIRRVEIRGVCERSRRVGEMHVTFKRYCRAVSPRRRPSFPAEKFTRQWWELRGGLLSRTFSRASRSTSGTTLSISVADSKFTFAIVVRNVLSIYPVTFIPAMPRRRFLACHLFCRNPIGIVDFLVAIYFQSSYGSVEDVIPRIWLPLFARIDRWDRPPLGIGNLISIESVISKGQRLRKRKFYIRDKRMVK